MAYGLNVNKGGHTKLQAFRELIEGFVAGAAEKNAYELGTLIVRQSGIMNEVYQSRDPENLSRQENIEELVNGMHDFCATREEEGNGNILLADYLSEVSLLTDQDNDKEGEADKVTLMTIHSAKAWNSRMYSSWGWRKTFSRVLCPSTRTRNWRKSAGCFMWP